MSALRATACGFSTLAHWVFARLPVPQPLDCTGAASGGREHREAPDLPDDVLAFLDQHLLDLGGSYGEPGAAASPLGARSYLDCSGGNVRVSCSSGHHRLVARAR